MRAPVISTPPRAYGSGTSGGPTRSRPRRRSGRDGSFARRRLSAVIEGNSNAAAASPRLLLHADCRALRQDGDGPRRSNRSWRAPGRRLDRRDIVEARLQPVGEAPAELERVGGRRAQHCASTSSSPASAPRIHCPAPDDGTQSQTPPRRRSPVTVPAARVTPRPSRGRDATRALTPDRWSTCGDSRTRREARDDSPAGSGTPGVACVETGQAHDCLLAIRSISSSTAAGSGCGPPLEAA